MPKFFWILLVATFVASLLGSPRAVLAQASPAASSPAVTAPAPAPASTTAAPAAPVTATSPAAPAVSSPAAPGTTAPAAAAPVAPQGAAPPATTEVVPDQGAPPPKPFIPSLLQGFILILYFLVCLALIACVMFQTTKNEGLTGIIGGQAQSSTLFKGGKKSFEEQLGLWTTRLAWTFLVSSLIIWLVLSRAT